MKPMLGTRWVAESESSVMTYPEDHIDAIVFAEPWAARHNAELWGSQPVSAS